MGKVARMLLDWGMYKYHIARDRFQCKKCDYHTKDEDAMIEHVKENHPELVGAKETIK